MKLGVVQKESTVEVSIRTSKQRCYLFAEGKFEKSRSERMNGTAAENAMRPR